MYGAGKLALWRRAGAGRAGRTHRDSTGSCSRPASPRCEWRPRPRSTTSSKHAEFCPWGETHGGSLGSEGRLDDTLDGVTVTEIRTKRAVLEDGVDEQPGSDCLLLKMLNGRPGRPRRSSCQQPRVPPRTVRGGCRRSLRPAESSRPSGLRASDRGGGGGQLARRYVELLRSLGDVQVIPQKTRLVGVARVRFAGLCPRKKGFLASFALHRWIDSPRIVKTADCGPGWRGHFIWIRAEQDLDDELSGWLQESHDTVGQQADLHPATHDRDDEPTAAASDGRALGGIGARRDRPQKRTKPDHR